jgi:hypothetical protein
MDDAHHDNAELVDKVLEAQPILSASRPLQALEGRAARSGRDIARIVVEKADRCILPDPFGLLALAVCLGRRPLVSAFDDEIRRPLKRIDRFPEQVGSADDFVGEPWSGVPRFPPRVLDLVVSKRIQQEHAALRCSIGSWPAWHSFGVGQRPTFEIGRQRRQ